MSDPQTSPDPAPADTASPDTESTDEGLSYEEARDELVSVVQQLETGGAGLEESLALWERGEALAAVCQRRLDGARERLDRATDDA